MIPSKVKVGGLEYRIIEKSFIEINNNRNYNGACDYESTTIELLETMSKPKKEEVFVHELTHAIFENAGYNEQDEEQIDRVSKVLYQILKDNQLTFE